MAMPANVTTVVVLGTFLTPEGTPSTGTVSFTPSSWLLNSGANIAIPNSTVTKSLGTAGNFTVTLPITDDADLSPSGWIYTVSEVVDGVSQSYNIAIPGTVAAGGTVFLADLTPVAPAGPEYYSLASSLSIGTVSTLAAGSAATASITGLAPSQTLNLGIPTGATGATGSAATIAVGTVGSVAYPGPGTVTNSGSSTAGTLNFTLVTGEQGPTGPTGPQGLAATIAVGTVTAGTAGGTPSVTNSGTSGSAVLDFVLVPGNTGPTGPQGSAATITVGTVTSVAFGGTAAVTNSGTSGSAVLDFVLVTGPQGNIGDLAATAPLDYTSSTFSLRYGAGLGTASGGTLVADLSSATPQALDTAGAAGTATQIARADHVHIRPTTGEIGAVGTATSITAGTGLAGGGDLSTSRTLDIVLATTAPAALGTAAVGTADNPARADHVHPTDGVVLDSLVDAAGDLLVGSADNTVGRLALGANGQVLTVDTAGTGVNKVKWAAAAAGGFDPFLLMGA